MKNDEDSIGIQHNVQSFDVSKTYFKYNFSSIICKQNKRFTFYINILCIVLFEKTTLFTNSI